MIDMGIKAENLTKEYKRGERAFLAVDSASLELSPGDFISIVGKSGSGKSTLLNMIAGLTVPTSGNVYADEKDIFSMSDLDASIYRNTKIGYVPQGQTALSKLSVLDNVRLPFHFFKREGDDVAKALELLEKVGISHLAGSYPKHLSGGELKRVAIARALMNDPEVLLADEPTSDLDVATTEEIVLLLKEVAQNGTAVLVVTHDLDATKHSNKNYEMHSGVLGIANN